jgi:hypothetical protein
MVRDGAEMETEDEYDSDEDHAFSCFLAGLSELGYGFGFASLDAQYFGLAQRRERVFVVGYPGAWQPAAAVLLDSESMSGHPAPSREAGQGTAGTLASRSMAGGGLGTDFDLGGGYKLSPPLTATGRGTDRAGESRGQDCVIPTTYMLDLENAGGQIAVTVSLRGREGGATAELGDDKAGALRAGGGGGDKAHVMERAAVRRLTPLECERLQGFPEIKKNVTIVVCSDQRKNYVLAEIQNPKSLNAAGHVDESQSTKSASSAGVHSSVSHHRNSKHAAVNVEIFCEEGIMRLAIPEHGWSESVRIADAMSHVFLHNSAGNFARLIAGTLSWSDLTVQRGGVAQPQNTSDSFLHRNGSGVVLISGQDIEATADDAVVNTLKVSDCLKYTISEVGLNSPIFDLPIQTWCCCVCRVINSFIPKQIRPENSFEIKHL